MPLLYAIDEWQANLAPAKCVKYLKRVRGRSFMSKQGHESSVSLVKRIEDLANVLLGSSVGEMELVEDGTEIIIKRQQEEKGVISLPQLHAQPTLRERKSPDRHPVAEDKSVAILAPLTGVFYPSPSPDSPPFVQIGDIIQLEQVVALVEAMKVFNEIQADVAGRLTQVVAVSGTIVKKGDVLFRIEPL